MCCPKLPGCFNPREVVYRQMKLIRTETVERMNEVLEVFLLILWTLQVIHGQQKHFFSVVVHRISNDFKNHLVLPLPLAKLDLLEALLGKMCLRMLSLLCLERGLLLQQQTMEPTICSKE